VEKIDMKEQIQILIELQGFDEEIFRLRKELALQPGKIRALEEGFKRKEEETRAAGSDLQKLQLEHKSKDNDLKSKEDAVKKLQTQLYQIKTNKEYTAMDTEIKNARADCSMLEEDIINLLDKIDEAEKLKGERNKLLKEEQENVEAEKKKINEETKRIEGELATLTTQRDALAEKVNKTLLSKYERILYGKDGLAMVPVKNDACQGCFLDLPPQVINMIKMKQELIFCESCARILYIDE
jgi:predicted  nucleic acid-binding Zn-ribbon protein